MRERRERERERVRGRRRTREGSEGEGRGEGWKAKRRGGKREIERERSRQERVKIPWPSPARTLGIPCCGGDRGALSPLSWLSSPTEQPSPRLEGIVGMLSSWIPGAPVGMEHGGPTVALIAAPVDHHSVATGVEGVNTNPPLPLRSRGPYRTRIMDFVFVRKHASKYGLTCLCAPGVNDSRHESESVISAGMQTPRHCFLPSFLPFFLLPPASKKRGEQRSGRDAISIAIPIWRYEYGNFEQGCVFDGEQLKNRLTSI